MFAKFAARQLSHPSGVVGTHVLPRIWNRRNAALNDAAFRALQLRPGDRVLEVGFGGGYLLQKIAAVVTRGLLVGVDASMAVTIHAAQGVRWGLDSGAVALSCAGVEALPLRSGSFTKVCSVNSLFYWPDLQAAFLEMARVLVPGGQVVLCFTCAASLKDKSFTRFGVSTHGDEEVARRLERAGLFVATRSHGHDRHREFLCLTAARA